MERTYTYSLRSNGDTKHIVDFSRSGITLCGRDFVWQVWHSPNSNGYGANEFNLSQLAVCKQCKRKADRLGMK